MTVACEADPDASRLTRDRPEADLRHTKTPHSAALAAPVAILAAAIAVLVAEAGELRGREAEHARVQRGALARARQPALGTEVAHLGEGGERQQGAPHRGLQRADRGRRQRAWAGLGIGLGLGLGTGLELGLGLGSVGLGLGLGLRLEPAAARRRARRGARRRARHAWVRG